MATEMGDGSFAGGVGGGADAAIVLDRREQGIEIEGFSVAMQKLDFDPYPKLVRKSREGGSRQQHLDKPMRSVPGGNYASC
jgi:hypothetical protein